MDKKHLRLIQLYKNLEEKKSQSRSNGYYSVFLSILNSNSKNERKDNAEPEYSYRQVYIRVNNQQQATTGNKDQFIMYSIQTGVREMVYAGFLPKNKELKNAITRSLFHRFNTAGFQAGVDTLAILSKKSNTSKNPTIAGNCLNDPPENCMMVFVPFVGYLPTCNIVCEQTGGGDGGSNNGDDTGSSSGSDSGSGSGSEGGDSKGGGGGGGNNGGNQGGGCSVRDGNTCGNDAPTNDEDDEQTSDPDSCKTSADEIEKAFPNASTKAKEKLEEVINKLGAKFGINTAPELQHFLAQAGHESGGFTTLEENLEDYTVENLQNTFGKYFNDKGENDPDKKDPSDYVGNGKEIANYVYANRNGNGNIASGDGYKYRGRGIIQLTGRANYKAFTDDYQNIFNSTKDFEKNPGLVASDEEIAVISATNFFKENVLDEIDIDKNTTVKEVTKEVNGGTNGLDDRKIHYQNVTEHITDCNK